VTDTEIASGNRFKRRKKGKENKSIIATEKRQENTRSAQARGHVADGKKKYKKITKRTRKRTRKTIATPRSPAKLHSERRMFLDQMDQRLPVGQVHFEIASSASTVFQRAVEIDSLRSKRLLCLPRERGGHGHGLDVRMSAFCAQTPDFEEYGTRVVGCVKSAERGFVPGGSNCHVLELLDYERLQYALISFFQNWRRDVRRNGTVCRMVCDGYDEDVASTWHCTDITVVNCT